MDFIDPKIERRNRFLLFAGYCLVALAIGIATLVLLYQVYGFGIDRQGNVTQTGLLFVSSQPSGATIKLNGQTYKATTNTRVTTLAGTYNVSVEKSGYRDWQRQVIVNGGDIQRFDYPFLFPSQLKTTSISSLATVPTMATQSLDRRWIVVALADTPGTFKLYDTKSPDKVVGSDFALPVDSFSASDGDQAWTPVEWAADNRHLLVTHTYTTGSTPHQEYILIDRDTPANSVNLTASLQLDDGQTLNLYNNRIDEVYAYSPTAQVLRRITVSNGVVASTLDHVLAFKPYGSNQILYVTDQPPTGKAVAGQVSVVLQVGQKTITLRTLPAAPAYVLNLAQYSGDWYIAVAANNDTAAYIYKNPQNAATSAVDTYPAPWRRLSITNPSYLAFSSNTQFLLAESGQEFVVYDLENIVQYRYHAKEPLDQPQPHASWMDGDRLLYTSSGKLLVFDYDYRNRQSLQAASPAYLPFFSPDYRYVYNLQSDTADTAKMSIMSTPLTVK